MKKAFEKTAAPLSSSTNKSPSQRNIINLLFQLPFIVDHFLKIKDSSYVLAENVLPCLSEQYLYTNGETEILILIQNYQIH